MRQRELLHRNLWGITLANSQNNFGTALVEVFVPLFLLSLGLSVKQIALFYLWYAGAKLLLNLPVVRVINRYGARLGLTLARIANCLFLLGLAMAGRHSLHWIIWLLPVCLALTNAFQWSSEHLHLSRVTSAGRLGSDLARIGTALLLATAVAPLFGSALTNAIGRSWLLVIAFVIVLSSALWLRSADKLAGGHQPADRITYDLRQAATRDVVANFAFNFHTATGSMVWPVYLAVILKSTTEIGLVTGLGTLIAIVLLLFAGKRTDNVGSRQVLREGSYATAIAHVLRLLANGVSSILSLNVAWSTVSKYQTNAWTSTYYEHTRRYGISYIMSMEIACDLAYVALWAFMLLGLSLLPLHSAFIAVFLLASVAALTCQLITNPVRTVN